MKAILASILLVNLIILLCKQEVSAERSWQHLEKRKSANRFLWLHPFRWLQRRFLKDDDDGPDANDDLAEEDDTILNLQKLSSNYKMPGMAESFGPGQFMFFGNELIYLPFNSMKNLNMNNDWLFKWTLHSLTSPGLVPIPGNPGLLSAAAASSLQHLFPSSSSSSSSQIASSSSNNPIFVFPNSHGRYSLHPNLLHPHHLHPQSIPNMMFKSQMPMRPFGSSHDQSNHNVNSRYSDDHHYDGGGIFYPTTTTPSPHSSSSRNPETNHHPKKDIAQSNQLTGRKTWSSYAAENEVKGSNNNVHSYVNHH